MTLPQRMPSKNATNKVGDYGLISKFAGYHAREDPTTLPPGTLVSPSQNVVIKTSGRVSLVAGYALDGAGSTVIDSGILSNFDFTPSFGAVRNLRAGSLTSAGNDGKLQYRYVDATGTVNWVNLVTSMTNVRLSYANWWDNTALVKNVLWVDGSNNVFGWNGAVATFASGTQNTVISMVGNNALLTSFGAVTGTSAFITGYNGGIGTALLGYVGLTTPPTNGQTLLLNINGGGTISIQFVSVIGVAAGNVLIGIDMAHTMANLLGLLQSPSTTNTTQVALSGPNQTVVGYITFASNTNTVTLQGTATWAQLGFTASGSIVIAGTTYTYAGGNYSTTLFGIGSNVSGSTVAAIIHQAVVTTALSGMTGIPATFAPSVVGCGRNNQLYVGSANSNVLYISKVNNYGDYTFTAAARKVGEGWTKVLDAPPTAFLALGDRTDVNTSDLYISQGADTWGMIQSTITVSYDSSGVAQNSIETLSYVRLGNAPLQGAKSNRLATMMKNHIVFVGNDNVANFLGWISYLNVPETVDFSYPIIDDMNSYDFTDASMFYHRNYIYIAIPKAGVVRIYNMTDQTKQTTMSTYHPYEDVDVASQPWFWEAPITYPIAGFYVVNGVLYGHSYTTSESYQLFTTGSFNGQQIDAAAVFSYDDKGDRTQSKASDELWIEGYIKQNTILSATVTGDLDAEASEQTVTVDGSDNSIVAYGGGAHALGKNNLGTQPLGGAVTSTATRPAWFHVSKTYPQVPFYLEQLSFTTKGVDLAWELICAGTNAKMTNESNNNITQ